MYLQNVKCNMSKQQDCKTYDKPAEFNIPSSQTQNVMSRVFVSDKDKLYYLLKGIDTEITPIFGKWLCEINKAYNPKSKT